MLLAWMKSWLTQTDFNSGSGVSTHENFFLFCRWRKTLERRRAAVKTYGEQSFSMASFSGDRFHGSYALKTFRALFGSGFLDHLGGISPSKAPAHGLWQAIQSLAAKL